MTPETDIDLVMLKALDGEALDAFERAALETHLDAHPEDRAMLARMAVVDRAFAALPLPVAPAGFSASVMSAVRAQPAPRNALSPGGAASFVVAGGLAFFAALAMIISATVLAVLIPSQAWVTWLSAASAILDSFLDLPRTILTLGFGFVSGVIEAPAGLAGLGMLAALVGGWMFAMLRLFAPKVALARR